MNEYTFSLTEDQVDAIVKKELFDQLQLVYDDYVRLINQPGELRAFEQRDLADHVRDIHGLKVAFRRYTIYQSDEYYKVDRFNLNIGDE